MKKTKQRKSKLELHLQEFRSLVEELMHTVALYETNYIELYLVSINEIVSLAP